MDMNQYLDIFIEETKEHLQSMNDLLLQLEKDQKNVNLINEIFRIAHTLKGMSGTMGFNNITHLTHEMENVLQNIRGGEIDINGNIIDLLFECFDQLEKYLYDIETNSNEGDNISEELIHKLKLLSQNKENKIQTKVKNNSNDGNQTDKDKKNIERKETVIDVDRHVGKVIKTAIQEEMNVYFIKITLDNKCMLKSARAYIIINALEKLSEIIHSNPSIEDIEDEKFDYTFELIVISKYHESFIQKELINIPEIDSVEFIVLGDGDFLISSQQENIYDNEENPVEYADDEEIYSDLSGEKNEETKARKSRTGKTVRVDIDRLDNLMNLVSELIIIKTRLEDIDDTGNKYGMNEAIEYLERITSNLHDAVMKVRMVPIERVFNRFPRMVRDLSKELGKEISLVMSGEETEVDRTVIDEIGDPLIHLIRNSIDHGIEEPDVRLKLGKKKNGTVKLNAYPDGNSVVIEVSDDGRGIDIEKVKKKAIEKGMIQPQQVQLMEEQDIIQFLFSPGFSTADKISDLSGRGVGLDVVKNRIESLGGAVEVNSQKDRGCTFIIRLPLTLAIIQALLVTVGKEKYAIPLNTIKEITTIQASSIRKVQNNEVVIYRNATLPILRLAELLNVPETGEERDEHVVVIVRKGEKNVGIIVDDLIGQQEIVIKSLGKFLSNTKSIAGATILGNGSVALIVDTNSFF